MTKTPTPNPSDQQRSDALTQLIADTILQAGGQIDFARFMEMVLYTPELGYYCSATPIFGKQGDFITAPELSPLFAQSVARQCQQILAHLKGGDIIELGAGSGKFACDLLSELEKLDWLPNHYFIFEKSATLRLQQKALVNHTLPHLIDRIHWLTELPSKKIKGIILANEVLDALPIHCFHIEDDCILERCVTIEKNHFAWKTMLPISPELSRCVNLIQYECALPPGYESEINLGLQNWLHLLAQSLEQGVMLFLDYGYGRREYYLPDRMQGTLMCYYQHHRHSDPFQLIGLQDITAHVDFTAVIEAAIDAELKLGGYTTQSAFLLACGLLDLSSSPTSEIEHYQTNQAIKKLTFPSQMGELVKVMALTKHIDISLLGFSLYDRRRSL